MNEFTEAQKQAIADITYAAFIRAYDEKHHPVQTFVRRVLTLVLGKKS